MRTLLALGGDDYTHRWLGTLADEEEADQWLHAIGGVEYVVDWFHALADTLQAGLISKDQVPQLNKLLKRLATSQKDGIEVPSEMLPAVAYACACLGRWKPAQWLEHMLLRRGCLMKKRMPEEFWERLIDRADPLLRLVALSVSPRTDPETLARLAHCGVPDVKKRARSHPNARRFQRIRAASRPASRTITATR